MSVHQENSDRNTATIIRVSPYVSAPVLNMFKIKKNTL